MLKVWVSCRWLSALFFVPCLSFGQVVEQEFEYTREFNWGISKNTNSGLIGGFTMKFSKRIGDDIFRTIGFEMMNVRHPKEQRYTSPQTGASFVYGKQNYLYTIRGQYGLEKIIFKKAPQQGVQIHVAAAAGPTIGIVAPYIIQSGGDTEQYDPLRHTNPAAIDGRGRVFEGLSHSEVVPGLNGKISTIFEFGTFRKNVAGIELGLMGEIFPKKILIVPTQKNRAFFTSAFFTLFWGSRR